MEVTKKVQLQAEKGFEYDWNSELKAFDDSKIGVKGFVDAGVEKIPHIFILEQQLTNDTSSDENFSIPLTYMEGVNNDLTSRAVIIDKLRSSCEKWDFFQVINHASGWGNWWNTKILWVRRCSEKGVLYFVVTSQERWCMLVVLICMRLHLLVGKIP